MRVKLRTANVSSDGIRGAGLDCEAFVEGLAVAIGERTSFEPDILVNCGPPIPRDQMTASKPVIVIEVLSPSMTYLAKSRQASQLTSPPSRTT
jgi:Uma2 family endonuclease